MSQEWVEHKLNLQNSQLNISKTNTVRQNLGFINPSLVGGGVKWSPQCSDPYCSE